MEHHDPYVSDAERERTVASLRDHLVAGRLTLEEFSERVELAYVARGGQELARAQHGLEPAAAELSPRRRPIRLTAALFSHVVRRGRLRLRRWTVALSAFSDVDLDLREAVLDGDASTVIVMVGFGNVDIYLPEGVNATVAGLAVVGHRREWGRDSARSDAPVIRLRVVSVFGTVDVWRVPPDLKGDYGEITRQLQLSPAAGHRE